MWLSSVFFIASTDSSTLFTFTEDSTLNMEKVPMTRQGYEALLAKLKKFKTVDRQKIIKEIEVARGFGDLSENAEYEAAKEKQGLIEKQIKDLEQKLTSAMIIDTRTLNSDKVIFGATVSLEDLDRDEKILYQIVGADEADVDQGKISIHSPIARALIGREEGDDVQVRTPGGLRNYTILGISFKGE
jgi:transcription elongation factor GreA